MKQDWCNIPVKVAVHSNEEKSDVITWLRHNIDDRDYDCDYTQYLAMRNYITVFFAKSKDAMLFSLYWS
jgi:hypothetical protein